LLFFQGALYGCALLALFGSLPASSQNQPLLFEHLTVDDGLSQNSVNAVLEDHKGFLWFGTQTA
jgi:ligand-binding sensor domain-containing protein